MQEGPAALSSPQSTQSHQDHRLLKTGHPAVIGIFGGRRGAPLGWCLPGSGWVAAGLGRSGHLTICPSINHWERQRPVTAGLGDLSNYCCPPLPEPPPLPLLLLLLFMLSLPHFLFLVLLCSITKCSGQLPGLRIFL